MNWPQLLLPAPLLIAIARVNCCEAKCRKWVWGADTHRNDGPSASEGDAHHISSGESEGFCCQRMSSPSPGINTIFFHLHILTADPQARQNGPKSIFAVALVWTSTLIHCVQSKILKWRRKNVTFLCSRTGLGFSGGLLVPINGNKGTNMHRINWTGHLSFYFDLFILRLHATAMPTESHPDVPWAIAQREMSYLELHRPGNFLYCLSLL